ncbi:AAEL004993-PA [Aedes aegypti]|uniref:AAEL004993-PA n=1 Tax=Aedes aegypti TaxID=7159 RepID=Q17BF5_AEDAE|nr:AAEL004993-PA [Aedes aegypti]
MGTVSVVALDSLTTTATTTVITLHRQRSATSISTIVRNFNARCSSIAVRLMETSSPRNMGNVRTGRQVTMVMITRTIPSRKKMRKKRKRAARFLRGLSINNITISTRTRWPRPAEASHKIVPEHCDTVKHSWESGNSFRCFSYTIIILNILRLFFQFSRYYPYIE